MNCTIKNFFLKMQKIFSLNVMVHKIRLLLLINMDRTIKKRGRVLSHIWYKGEDLRGKARAQL